MARPDRGRRARPPHVPRPDGQAVQAREAKEGFPAGQLSGLVKLNIGNPGADTRQAARWAPGPHEPAVYDDRLRFNVVLVDDLCVTQPYLAESRGVESPAFVVRRRPGRGGLYPVFEQFFETERRPGAATVNDYRHLVPVAIEAVARAAKTMRRRPPGALTVKGHGPDTSFDNTAA
ncbi:DUF5919 domain-containing protein [Micromonospora sp. CPCC 205546]